MHPKLPVAEMMASKLSQHRLAVAIKFSVIAVAVLAFYMQDLSMVFKGALTDESTFHILAIPFLFVFLLFRKRKMVNAAIQLPQPKTTSFQKYFSTLIGITLSLVAILTYWYGSYTFTPIEYHMVTLPFLAAGLILILFNIHTLRQLIFPIAFLILLTPPPGELLFGLGSALANLSASASNSLVNIFGIHATLSSSNVGPIITLLKPDQTTLAFNVDVACSGIYSIIGFVIFALFIAYITRGKLSNKFFILLMGIPLILVLNIIRITVSLSLGYNYGEDLALQMFHTVGATVLMFIGTLLLLVISEKAFKKAKPPSPCPTCNSTPKISVKPFCTNCGKLFEYSKTKLNKTDLTKIVGIAIVLVMLLSIQAPVFALTQGPAQVIVQTPSGIEVDASNPLLPTINGYTLKYVYRDTDFEKQSGDQAALAYSYTSTNGTRQTVWVALQIAPSTTTEHRWEVCLITWPLSQGDQTTVNQLALEDLQIQENPPMTARYFAFQYKNTNQTQAVLYWFETAKFNTNNTAQTKNVMISLVMYPNSPSDISNIRTKELLIAKSINNYWQPIQTWNTITLAISQNGLVLSAATTIALIMLILYRLILINQEKSSILILYNKLPTKNQLLIKAIQKAKKQGSPTTEQIAKELTKQNNTQIDRDSLRRDLEEAEKIGLIEKQLVNNNDQPAIAWKSLLPERNILKTLSIKSRLIRNSHQDIH